ncbi:AAA family ATPase [Phytohabitans rumicis]|uniref:AAA family ATPase n=1 Tax=Phytohabitans rumicis TaxID=1076125 RepID=UPI001FE8D98F|nr:MoxR family ATPase [Phytohabitans rumicis]
MTAPDFASPEELAAALDVQNYLADEGLATAAFVARKLGRPLFLEGEPGVGKTVFARTLAAAMGVPFRRLQCYGGIEASQALYDWNFPGQILELRAAEAGGRKPSSASLYEERFLIERPILKAIRESPAVVLLIDEIDRADDEFEAFLLEVLDDYAVSIPELGERISAPAPPMVVLTSNQTRDVHDAIKRRCVYHWIDHPELDRETDIVRRNLPDGCEPLARQVATLMVELRRVELVKQPGVAESVCLAQGVLALGADVLDPRRTAAALGTVVKHRDDWEKVRALLPRLMPG